MKVFVFLFIAIFFLGKAVGYAATAAPQDASTAPVTDPALVAAHYREMLARPEFQEIGEADSNSEFKEWLSQWFTHLGAAFGDFKYAQEMPRVASLLMTLLVILSLAGLLYTVVRLGRKRRIARPPETMGNPARRVLHPPGFYAEELRQAAAAGDWHAAWLATWRQFLSRLEKGHLVETDRSRTNREYLAQLRAETTAVPPSALALLAGMVDAYDTFIYGRRTIAESDWKSFHGQADEAALLLHVRERSTTSANPSGMP